MTIKLVNTTPGDSAEPLTPGGPLFAGLRSETGEVDFTSIQARIGYSNITHVTEPNGLGVLPEANPKLPHVSFDSPERWRPVVNDVPIFLSGSGVGVGPGVDPTKSQRGVYEVTVPVTEHTPVLAMVTVKVSTWSSSNHFWSDRPNLMPLYLGLEYGPLNTGLFVHLRDDGAGGSIVAGGPLQAFGQPRPGQMEFDDLRWLENSANRSLTLFLLIDPKSMEAQVWAQRATDAAPVKMSPIALRMLGTFRSSTSGFSQQREGPKSEVRLFFGCDGGPGDSVIFEDYAIYQNFPKAVVYGAAEPGHGLACLPETPHAYRADSGILPHSTVATGRWFPADPTVPLDAKFYFQPGRRSAPLYLTLAKTAQSKQVALRRSEPRLGATQSGFVVEAWMGGSLEEPVTASVGMGFYVEDGSYRYQVVMLDNQVVRTYGILRGGGANPYDFAAGYWTPGNGAADYDYRGLRYVRLSLDRSRQQLCLFIDDPNVPVLTLDTSDTSIVFPPSSAATGSIVVGHVDYLALAGDFNLGLLNYLVDYASWDVADGAGPFYFDTSETSSDSYEVGDTSMLIRKDAARSSYARQRAPAKLSARRGFQVDFRARVLSYQNVDGSLKNHPGVWTGAGVTAYLGNLETSGNNWAKVTVGFFDCGVYGRKIGVIPGEGGIDDILTQTALGIQHSASVDWTQMGTYRIVYIPFSRIEVWDAAYLQKPIISIPWNKERVSFALQDDPDETDPALAFGMFSDVMAGTSEWEYVRWGSSHGYDVRITQTPPEDLTQIFDGRVFVSMSADEVREV